jgi:hypothetical protein
VYGFALFGPKFSLTPAAIQSVRAIYRIQPEMPSPKCNSREPSECPQANDLLGLFRNPEVPMWHKCGVFFRAMHPDTAGMPACVFSRNKTGTFWKEMLCVDNRGIAKFAGSASV